MVHMQQGVESLTELSLANASFVQALTERPGDGGDDGSVAAAAEWVARAGVMCNTFNLPAGGAGHKCSSPEVRR